jgi:hypothetical protein
MGWHGLHSSESGQGPVAGSYKHRNEPSGSRRGWEFLEYRSVASQEGLGFMVFVSCFAGVVSTDDGEKVVSGRA